MPFIRYRAARIYDLFVNHAMQSITLVMTGFLKGCECDCRFKMPAFTVGNCKLTPELKETLPSTDSRFRRDSSLIEAGKWKEVTPRALLFDLNDQIVQALPLQVLKSLY